MKRPFACFILGLCALSSGCSLAWNATSNLAEETHHHLDEMVADVRHKKLANAVWNEARAQAPSHSYSQDHAAGFKAGFVDFVAAGGTGEPPSVPPPKYWKASYGTPQGYRAIEDWFAGFRHGATVARESGFRRWAVMPSPLSGSSEGPALPPQPWQEPAFGAKGKPPLPDGRGRAVLPELITGPGQGSANVHSASQEYEGNQGPVQTPQPPQRIRIPVTVRPSARPAEAAMETSRPAADRPPSETEGPVLPPAGEQELLRPIVLKVRPANVPEPRPPTPPTPSETGPSLGTSPPAETGPDLEIPSPPNPVPESR